MKRMIQIETTAEGAETFIRRMEQSGYRAVRVSDLTRTDVHFELNGQTSLNYAVTINPGNAAHIGVRPE